MKRAWKGVKEQGMTQVDAALTFGVPRSTLQVYLKKNLNEIPEDIHSGRFKTVFSKEQEQQLVDDLIEFSHRYYSMSRKALVQSAYRLAEANGLQHPFKNGQAGSDWAHGFMKRHKDRLSMRTAQPVSIDRIFGYRKAPVYRFFDILESIVSKENYQPHQIFNCDETGVTVVMSRSPRVIAQRGAKNVARIKSVERGSLVTVMGCASAGGMFVPPFFIFSGSKHRNQDAKVALGPAGSDSSNSKRGWMVSEVFIDWLHHFVNYVQPNEDNKVLLIMDNLKAHITLEAIEFARSNFIDVLTMPPHTSHRLQPLDVGFFGPLKSRLNEALMNWQNVHRYAKPTQHDIPAILKIPFNDSAKPETAINAFSKTGIWVRASNGPNRHVLNPDEFYPEDGDYNNRESLNVNRNGRNDGDDDSSGTDGPDFDPNEANSGNNDPGESNEHGVNLNSDEQESSVYNALDSSADDIGHTGDDVEFHLEADSGEHFNVPGILSEEEDPSALSQHLLDSIILFNAPQDEQATNQPASSSPMQNSMDLAVPRQDSDSSSSSSRPTSEGSINSTNVQDYPVINDLNENSPSSEPQQSGKSPQLGVTLMDLDAHHLPVPPKASTRQTQCDLVTASSYIEERKQKQLFASKKKVAKKSPGANPRSAQSKLRKSIIKTRQRLAEMAEIASNPTRKQPARAVKK